MVVQEKLAKDNNGIARRINELGLSLHKVRLIDWNPMFIIMLYDDSETFNPEVGKKKTG